MRLRLREGVMMIEGHLREEPGHVDTGPQDGLAVQHWHRAGDGGLDTATQINTDITLQYCFDMSQPQKGKHECS